MAREFGLSKSKLMAVRQCPRRLWLSVHMSDCVPEDDANDAILATGTEVGVIARQGWPDGILIAPEGPLTEALSQTQAVLPARKPLFEATVQKDGVLVRADILVPRYRGKAFDLIEVKSSTSVKDHYLEDIAIQARIFEAAGVPLKRRVLQYINNQFVYPGDLTLPQFRGHLMSRERWPRTSWGSYIPMSSDDACDCKTLRCIRK